MSIVYLLSGSNLGNRREHLSNALKEIQHLAGKIIKVSQVFESPAWGFEHPNLFLNQAIMLETNLSPDALLTVLLAIENKHGRIRTQHGYEARHLDLDILFFDNLIVDKEDLSIPHPRLHMRRFVLLPMSGIAAELIHPLLKKSIAELLKECPDQSMVYEHTENNNKAEERKQKG
ncbi:MAG: 2-amino-4-hydroxy-6-hydroxymethyldihydropteridine diphosphokinase [Bacteroidota bacterium]